MQTSAKEIITPKLFTDGFLHMVKFHTQQWPGIRINFST